MQLISVKSKQKLKMFNVVLFIGGLLVSNSLLAGETDIQLAAAHDGKLSVANAKSMNAKSEMGSENVSKSDNRIGAFSREDGAMMGAYGDGEYSNDD